MARTRHSSLTLTLDADSGVALHEQIYLELVTEGYLRAVPRSGYVVEEIDTDFFLDERADTRRDVQDAMAAAASTGLAGEELVGRAAANSLRAIMRSNADIELAYKVSDANVGISEHGVVTVPHYTAMYL